MSELIDREATVKQMCKMGEMVGGHDRDVVISIALFVQDDKTAFPTVDRPHGEWLRKNNSNSWFECSVCKEVSDVVTIMREPTWKFCPNCGADMREVGERNEVD